MSDPFDPASPTSVAIMQPVLRALGAERDVPARISGFPSACRWVPPIRTLMCATSVVSPRSARDAMVTLAWQHHIDSVVIAHGPHPEILDPVEVDVVIGRHGPARIFWRYVPARAIDSGYWFFPPAGQPGPCLKLDQTGIVPASQPPYASPDERADCIATAARETILMLRRGHRS